MILAERYDIIRPLAQGGFGKTFLACDRYLPSHPYCVIKQLHLTQATPSTLKTAQRLFNLEAETLYKLGTHSQIPSLLAHFEQAGEFYLVQDYIEGPLLEAELSELTGSILSRVDYVQSLLKELLSVLSFVHRHDVIHRDIKPSNLIRRMGDNQIVLIDFGAVKAIATTQPLSTISIGSSGYIAPEQQAGRPCLASDLYAVGIIALQALTGLSPQLFSTDATTGRLSLLEIVGELEGSQLFLFLEKLLHPYASNRFPDASTALESLINIFASSSSSWHSPKGITQQNSPFPTTTLRRAENRLSTDQPTDHKDISTTLAPQTPVLQSFSPTQLRNRQALLNKVHRFWIQGVLHHSLHGQVLLTLGLEERATALALPWNISYQSDTSSAQPIAADTRISDIFQQMGEGRSLLILGEPGAGKTTTLLTLTQDLLQQSDISKRIPAVFNLSSWTGEPIEQWLVTELKSKYQIPKAIGTEWVQQQQLLLLLDGLDEVRPDRQTSCATAINQFYQNYGPEIVVCCRIKDYEAMGEKLGFQSAIYVRSLTDAQIWKYLNQSETGLTGLKSLLGKNVTDNRKRDPENPSLLDLARSPLILNIMTLTYQGISAADIPALTQTSSSAYTHQLFSAYIARMFQRRLTTSSPYSEAQTLQWLHNLAIQLTAASQTVFLIEQMQPLEWLISRRSRILYAVLFWTCFFVVSATIGYFVVSHRSLPLALLIGAVLCARMFGTYRIVPAESFRWSWKKARRAFLLGLTIGPAVGWLLKVGFVYIFGEAYCVFDQACLFDKSAVGLGFGLTLGITYGIIRGLSGERIAVRTKPNQGMRQSAKNAILFAVVSAIAPPFVALFLKYTSPYFWTAAGLSFGLAMGGGEAVVKHGILRFVLFCQGRMPWNYAKFLNYAAERILLQKVGGGYIFIHRLLLEHFAKVSLAEAPFAEVPLEKGTESDKHIV
ncbi:MAG: protein kinase [Cyanobacteria bacterium P01_D01_bin.105]